MEKRLKVLLLLTRPIPKKPTNGRERVMGFLLASLESTAVVSRLQCPTIFSSQSPLKWMHFIFLSGLNLIKKDPLPLQATIFNVLGTWASIKNAIESSRPDYVYLDSIRLGVFARKIRAEFPTIQVVCDYDDLMSRRYGILAKQKYPIKIGYLEKMIPKWIATTLLNKSLASSIQTHEARTLEKLEISVAKQCARIILISSKEAGILEEKVGRRNIYTVPPHVNLKRPFSKYSSIERFIFVGSDSLLQNRVAIDRCLEIWEEFKPMHELHIFGKQHRVYRKIPNVVIRGFVEASNDIYQPNVVLLLPTTIPGGVKTKILDGIENGIVPIGVAEVFEGILGCCSPLVFTNEAINDLVRNPHNWIDYLNEQAVPACKTIAEKHSSENIQNAIFKSVFGLDTTSLEMTK